MHTEKKIDVGQYKALLTLALACNVFALFSAPAQETNPPAAQTNAAGEVISAEASDASSNATDTAEPNEQMTKRSGRGISREAMVIIGDDAELKAGETAEAVVVVGGSATIRGRVRQGAVVVGGNLYVEGEVGDAAVAVMGNVSAAKNAKIHGEIVAVGGKANVSEGAQVDGRVQEVDVGFALPHLDWLKKWVVHCLLKMRPLAPQVGWVWVVWAVFLLIYLLIVTAFPRPVQACIDELTRRPATSFLMGILTKLLLPFVLLLLIVTVVGAVVVPFVLAALFLGFLVGKAALLEWLGLKLGRQFGNEAFQKPAAAFLLGALVITVLYLVPILGMITFAIVSVWGLGAAVKAAFAGLRRELPDKPVKPTAPITPQPVPPIAPTEGGFASPPIAAAPAGTTLHAQVVPPHLPTEPPPSEIPSPEAPPIAPDITAQPALPGGAAAAALLPDAWAYPKASFWERMAAAFLDLILVSILGAVVGGPPLGFLVALAYFAGMWTWRATTIGGIVIGLKVARVDGQHLTFTVALVRALAAAFSVIVLFLGFLWIIWDKDKQGWHDRIAGTVVVKLPRGTPLVCL